MRREQGGPHAWALSSLARETKGHGGLRAEGAVAATTLNPAAHHIKIRDDGSGLLWNDISSRLQLNARDSLWLHKLTAARLCSMRRAQLKYSAALVVRTELQCSTSK